MGQRVTRRGRRNPCDSRRCPPRFEGAVMLNVTANKTASGGPFRRSRTSSTRRFCARTRAPVVREMGYDTTQPRAIQKSVMVNQCQSLPGTHAYNDCTMRALATSSAFHFEQLVVFPATGVHATPDVFSAATRASAEQSHVP